MAPSVPSAPEDGKGSAKRVHTGKYVDMKSDDGRQTMWGGKKIIIAVSNFAAHHNGAVITCDSAVRHSESRLECFGNVLINKGTTYVYGDKAEYNSETNEAKVFSQIIKVVDQKTVLYCYNFTFNTKTNVGEFYGGGVVRSDDNHIECQKGYYYADLKRVACVKQVQMRNDTYSMKGDSVIYDMLNDRAYFFDNTNIWNEPENEYLYADRGEFDKQLQRYYITRSGYILTPEAEAWSDSIDYYRERGYVKMLSRLQLDNQKDKMMAFGDWGEYWKEEGNAFLTRNPSVLSYDTQQSDSVFIRSDSMYILTVRVGEKQQGDSLQVAQSRQVEQDPQSVDGAQANAAGESVRDRAKKAESQTGQRKERAGSGRTPEAPPVAEQKAQEDAAPASEVADSLPQNLSAQDSTRLDSLAQAADTLTLKQKKALLKEQKRRQAAELRRIRRDSLEAKLDRIAERRQAKKTAILKRFAAQDSIRNLKRIHRENLRRQKMLEKLARKGVKLKLDSMLLYRADTAFMHDYSHVDSVAQRFLDSLIIVTAPVDSLYGRADTLKADSTYKLLKAFSRVKMFRQDAQMICDSLSSSSVDSIIHLYKHPVLWNESNQIISEVMHITTRNQQIERADFEGKPISIMEVDTGRYNQISGKEMKALFQNNQIFRNDVNGNVQTIYYIQEGDDQEVTMMAYVESADMSTYIEDRKVVGITYRGNPQYTFYPIDKIPQTQPQRLKDFAWFASERPSRDSVFYGRVLRPTRRTEVERMRKPSFPLTLQLDRKREALEKIKSWFDRTDTLSVETIEWLRSLKTLY